MQKSNLISYLKQFSKRDWREFRKFVNSPFFNQREDVILLFEYLDKAIHFLKPIELNRQKVFNQIFPKKEFDEIQLRHTTSFLLKVIKKYLAYTEYENDFNKDHHYFCKSLKRRGMDIFYEKELLIAQKKLSSSSFRDSAFFYKSYELEVESAAYTMKKRRIGEMNFQISNNQLTKFYISSMMRLGCNIQSHQNMSSQIYDLKLFPQILELIENGDFQEEPMIEMYFHCYKSIEKLESKKLIDSEIYFNKLKNLIELRWKELSSSDIRDVYLFAINYCIKRLNAGSREYIREAFELFRSGLKNGNLLEEGILSSFTYKNVTRLGVALEENIWVEQFLTDYKKYLDPKEKENAWRYNLAFLYFKQKRYIEAMPLLIRVEFKDVLNNLDARRMLLKSYFELNELDALESLLESFSRYIQRQKEMGYHRDNYLNLISFVRRIMFTKKGKTDFKKIEAEVRNVQHLADRDWLLEKIKSRVQNP